MPEPTHNGSTDWIEETSSSSTRLPTRRLQRTVQEKSILRASINSLSPGQWEAPPIRNYFEPTNESHCLAFLLQVGSEPACSTAKWLRLLKCLKILINRSFRHGEILFESTASIDSIADTISASGRVRPFDDAAFLYHLPFFASVYLSQRVRPRRYFLSPLLDNAPVNELLHAPTNAQVHQLL